MPPRSAPARGIAPHPEGLDTLPGDLLRIPSGLFTLMAAAGCGVLLVSIASGAAAGWSGAHVAAAAFGGAALPMGVAGRILLAAFHQGAALTVKGFVLTWRRMDRAGTPAADRLDEDPSADGRPWTRAGRRQA